MKLNENLSFEYLSNCIQNTKGGVSFWGTRYAYTQNEAIKLDDIATCVIQIFKKNPNFDEKERAFAKKLVDKVDCLYSESKTASSERNLLSRILYFVSELFIINICNFGYGIRFHWNAKKDFVNLYTKSQWISAFGSSPPYQPSHYSSGLPPRWRQPQMKHA